MIFNGPTGWYNEATGQWDKPEPDLPRFITQPRLEVELVPRTCWWSNVRSNVSKADWERCKNYVKLRSGSCCEVCDGRGARYPVDCHEIWHYDDERKIQTLVDLIALCPRCHEVKHIGRAFATGNADRAIAHLATINGWDDVRVERYLEIQFEIFTLRSEYAWSLDISFLKRVLGIDAVVGDR